MANNCENVHVRFSTFFILENVGKIKNVKKRKKRFYIYGLDPLDLSWMHDSHGVYTLRPPTAGPCGLVELS